MPSAAGRTVPYKRGNDPRSPGRPTLRARARAFFLSRGEHAAGARARAHFVRIGDNRNDEVACGVMLYHSRERLLERPLIGENVVAVGSGDVLLQLH